MSENLYEVLALGMRYWFAVLGVLIVLRSFLWLRRDRHEEKKRLRRLPDAGTVGELVVIQGTRDLPEGAVIAVPWEGVLGFNRGCDVVVPAGGVAARHLDFSFEERVGLLLRLRRGCACIVDGQPLTPRSKPRKTPMLHGSTLAIGDAVLKLRVFAGIDVEHHVALAEDVPPPEQAAPFVPQQPAPWPGQAALWQAPPAPTDLPSPDAPQPPVGWRTPPEPWPIPSVQPGTVPPQGQSAPMPDYGQAGYPPPMTAADQAPMFPEMPSDPADAPYVRRRRRGRRDADA